MFPYVPEPGADPGPWASDDLRRLHLAGVRLAARTLAEQVRCKAAGVPEPDSVARAYRDEGELLAMGLATLLMAQLDQRRPGHLASWLETVAITYTRRLDDERQWDAAMERMGAEIEAHELEAVRRDHDGEDYDPADYAVQWVDEIEDDQEIDR